MQSDLKEFTDIVFMHSDPRGMAVEVTRLLRSTRCVSLHRDDAHSLGLEPFLHFQIMIPCCLTQVRIPCFGGIAVIFHSFQRRLERPNGIIRFCLITNSSYCWFHSWMCMRWMVLRPCELCCNPAQKRCVHPKLISLLLLLLHLQRWNLFTQARSGAQRGVKLLNTRKINVNAKLQGTDHLVGVDSRQRPVFISITVVAWLADVITLGWVIFIIIVAGLRLAIESHKKLKFDLRASKNELEEISKQLDAQTELVSVLLEQAKESNSKSSGTPAPSLILPNLKGNFADTHFDNSVAEAATQPTLSEIADKKDKELCLHPLCTKSLNVSKRYHASRLPCTYS